MGRKKFAEAGFIRKAHGVKGELKADFLFPPFLKEILNFSTLYLGNNANPLPYFLKNLQDTGKGDFIVQFDNCNTRNDADELIGKNIFVPLEKLDDLFDTSEITEYNKLIGFTVLNTEGETLGEIADIFELPQHWLAQIFIDNKEALLPLNENTIIKLSKKNKTVTLELPEGILDL